MAIVITNDKRLARREVIIKNTHRGLRYEDGVLVRVLDAGRHVLPGRLSLPFLRRRPRVELVLVDVRERELTIKGQEILTSDKVAIRVSIVVQFRVTDPAAALQQVAEYEDRLYSDVQLAARRSLASMTLEDILTNRTRLSEDILADVLGAAAGYGVQILRADVKDLIFPGNLQEIMNRVLATERLSQAELVQARTKAEAQRIEAEAKAEARRVEAVAEVERQRLTAEADAEAERIRTAAEVDAVRQREQVAQVFTASPALLRLRELETLRELAQVANARIYIGFPKHVRPDADGVDRD
jgi:regulator of protease activity HflC (stomatin/prohibitin superfamily)